MLVLTLADTGLFDWEGWIEIDPILCGIAYSILAVVSLCFFVREARNEKAD